MSTRRWFCADCNMGGAGDLAAHMASHRAGSTVQRGRVCSVHGEWCADGTCRLCEPLLETGLEYGWPGAAAFTWKSAPKSIVPVSTGGWNEAYAQERQSAPVTRDPEGHLR